MPSTRFVRRALTLAGAAGLAVAVALPATASAAPAASAPGWRVVQKLGPSGSAWSTSFTAVSAADAWAISTARGYNDLQRWNGRTWQRVSIPASLAGSVGGGVPIAATAASGLWAFDGTSSSLIRYDDGKWRSQSLPKWVMHGNLAGEIDVAPAVFSPGNLWVFSLGWDKMTDPDHYAAHYNGRTWAKVQLPAVPYAVSAVSPTDIWANGPSLKNISGRVLMHWNGKAWSTVPMPKVSVPKGDTVQYSGLLATGPANAWMLAYVASSSLVAVKTDLLHWTGRSWANVPIKYPSVNVAYLTPDGGGGLWMNEWANGPVSAEHFYHLSDGRWSEYAVPGGASVQPPGLTWIPGTRSLWATAETFPSDTTAETEILKYGA
jgi:hypothetical protein